MSLTTRTAADLARRVRAGEVSPVDIVEAHLDRIDRVDPQVHAWTSVDREGALALARTLDAQARAGHIRGPLHGVPVGLKDIIHAAGMVTTAGAAPYAHERPTRDATVARLLRDAGAIILGKTESTEFAYTDPTATRNAWNLNHIPGGSSSGSGAAVGARMVPVALGTQTVGSVLRPAAYNGCVGVKPSYGRASAAGIHALAWSFDHVGVICRSVEDAALVLSVIAGYDPEDPHSVAAPVGDYVRAVQRPRPPRLGVPRRLFDSVADAETRAHVAAVGEALGRAGATVCDVAAPSSADDVADAGRIIMRVECATYHQERFAAHAAEFRPNLRALIESGLATPAIDYVRARGRRAQFRREMRSSIHAYDGFLMPVVPSPPGTDFSTTGDPVLCGFWSYAGFPAMALPSGLSRGGLPLALQLIAAPFEEERLLGVARWCEQVLAFDATPPEHA
jgi:aspartyl-tRNA(Asn)/glutamyl-tRNA(Gln) amidotransferase subunit A